MMGAVINFTEHQEMTDRLPPEEWSRRLRQWLLKKALVYSPK